MERIKKTLTKSKKIRPEIISIMLDTKGVERDEGPEELQMKSRTLQVLSKEQKGLLSGKNKISCFSFIMYIIMDHIRVWEAEK